jgi:hypothetical protein
MFILEREIRNYRALLLYLVIAAQMKLRKCNLRVLFQECMLNMQFTSPVSARLIDVSGSVLKFKSRLFIPYYATCALAVSAIS